MLNGLSLRFRPEYVDALIIYEEVFVEKVYNLSLLPFAPDVVIDCGGFHGHFTLLARVRFPPAKFVVFEPSPTNYLAMRDNFKHCNIDPEVDSRLEAVSTHDGAMSFTGEGFGGHLNYETNGCAASSGPVPVTNLCNLVSGLAPCRLLLKLDVEGEERRILLDLIPLLPPECALFSSGTTTRRNFRRLMLCYAPLALKSSIAGQGN
jgi:FkbM family methyltransferase